MANSLADCFRMALYDEFPGQRVQRSMRSGSRSPRYFA
uniref:Uncharacterized protein n=1 Tax=Klebsiella pneumoniae TaxID=573 RepID=A0A8B0STG3_KLEPN|nr:hypothetical protein [Klebsiella pneumoniae]